MKVIFWNTDTQRDFMNPDGKLHVKSAELIKPKLKEITEFAEKNKITVVNTADCHNKNSKEISDKPDFKTTFPPHCMLLGGDGIDFIEETDPKKDFKGNYTMVCYSDKGLHHSFSRARNIIIYKDAFDVFEGNHLTNEVIDKLKPDVAIVYGVATNICVNYAVLGLLERKVTPYIVRDAIKELPDTNVEQFFKDWSDKRAHCSLDWNKIKQLLDGAV